MEKNSPPKIDDTWNFRGKLMENCYPLFDGEYRWHKIQNCPRCKAKQSIKLVFGGCQVQKMEPLGNMQLWDAL